MGKTLKDYDSPLDPIAELTDIRGGVNQFSDITRDVVNLPPVSFGNIRGRQTEPKKNGANARGKPPFFPTLLPEVSEGVTIIKLRMVTGFIHTQKNVEDAMVDLEVVGIPVSGSEITVTAGTKCYVSAQEDAYGTISEPQFGTGSDWPTSIPPVLIGGDNIEGSPGVRYWRLCEINGEDSVTIHRTGIIEHFIPRRIENASNSMSSNQGRFYKEYLDTDYGIYQMRVAWGLRGLCVEEEDDQTENHLKLLMPPGSDGAILYFTGANSEDDEIGEWIKLDAPYPPASDGYEWLLKNVPEGPPAWIQVPTDGGGGGGEYHPWKVTVGGIVEGVQQWNYAGGEIYTQGTMQTVAGGTLSGAGSFVVLSFDRDIDTREIDPDSAEVTLKTTVPDSDYNTQYRVLAKINTPSSLEVLQLQFEEIRIYEELVVENGEFKLQGYEVSHRNNYQPPT